MIGALPPATQPTPSQRPALETFQAPQPAAIEAPLSATPEGGDHGYNGKVSYNGQQISVKNGMAEFNGELYFVSDDGAFVVDKDHMVVGRVVNGEFMEIDDQYLAELQAKGMLEDQA